MQISATEVDSMNGAGADPSTSGKPAMASAAAAPAATSAAPAATAAAPAATAAAPASSPLEPLEPLEPFELLTLSWPRPIRHAEGAWLSEPDWHAPLMAREARWNVATGETLWTLDLREHFRGLLRAYTPGGDLRSFHTVFRVRATRSGAFQFRASGPCWVKAGGQVVYKHTSRTRRGLQSVDVQANDLLEIALAKFENDWEFGALIVETSLTELKSPEEFIERYLPLVTAKLARPNGPALKFYTHGQMPLRSMLCVYSLILNGYAPSRIILYGEDQWQPSVREFFARALPFAQVVSTAEVLCRLRELGGLTLCDMARTWYTMKACIALLMPPEVYCVLDDDVFVLGSAGDALEAFSVCDLVYMSDADWCGPYLETWGFMPGGARPMTTGNFNAGLYLARSFADPRTIASYMLRIRPERTQSYIWEQGFIATLYRDRRTHALPSGKYLMPLWAGLPGGPAGYDYARNPCEFVAVHYAALENKPDDMLSLALAPQVLARY